MATDRSIFLGIDVGTGGVRALAVSDDGQVFAQASEPLPDDILSPQSGRHEQQPLVWWAAVCRATKSLVGTLQQHRIRSGQLAAVAVDGTSGTLVVLDPKGNPLRPALMYNDPRPTSEADELNEAAGSFCDKLGYRFKSSFALAKILWLKNHEPSLFGKAARFVHQADFIQQRLTGRTAVSDYSNALKTGYDLVDECWPSWIDEVAPIVGRLPEVVAPGTQIGTISATAAAETGLPEGLPVATGASDGTAAFLASGAHRPGDYNTTLGTTLVFKGISREICRHGEGLIYCHRLPGGLWLPGAAGNVGCHWMTEWFAGCDVIEMDAAAAERLPSATVAYPLARRGERFPFLCDAAEGFLVPEPSNPAERYAACLQGVALVERLAYEVLDRAAEEARSPAAVAENAGTLGAIFSTGGGSQSDVWMQCRSDATGRIVHRPKCGQSAFGAAVLAAVAGHYGTAPEAVAQMVRISRSFHPNSEQASAYQGRYNEFVDQLQTRGYL